MTSVVTISKLELIELVQNEVRKNFPSFIVGREFHDQLPEQVTVNLTPALKQNEGAKR